MNAAARATGPASCGAATRPGAATRCGAASLGGAVVLAAMLWSVGFAAGAGPLPLYEHPEAPLDARVEDLLSRLTLAEEISLMAGGSSFATEPIPRLGIPALRVSDGPNGVRSNDDRPATVFPTGAALAATWNPAVLQAVGAAIGREALSMHVQVMLGPDVNIQRVPLAGRDFEDYSEDPFLSGTLGVAFVRGLQSQGVGATVKHFVGNEQELDRMRVSSNVDERTLHEIYLLPFEMIVKQAHPWAVMLSYNRLNGTYMTENRRLIRDILERDWGFDGMVMSDWGAVHSTVAAANAGVDLEMPGPPSYFGTRLARAVANWQVDRSAVDDAARRVLRTLIRSGLLDGKPRPSGERLSERNRATALLAAREAITLLENRGGLLPLVESRIHTLAVIGPEADAPLYEGGGSASVIPSRIATPLMSLRHLVGGSVKILYAQGVDNDPVPPPADARLLSPTASRAEQGLEFSYYDNADFRGRPVRGGIETYFDKTMLAGELTQMSARWEGYLWPPKDGEYEFSLSQIGRAMLYVDGRAIIGGGRGRTLPAQVDFGASLQVAKVALRAGRHYRIRVDYVSSPITFHSLHFGVRVPPGTIEEAVRAARSADVAIVFVGSSPSTETEGRDRQSLQLEGRQNELIEAVLAANPRTVIVLNTGSPRLLPWADRAPAIIEGWLAGEEEPDAIAQVLFGEVNPSGKLPFTFPRRLEDTPTYLYYPADRDADYGEGVFVGYRYYDKRKIEPQFPFGHGLSYTTFEYSNLHVPATVPVGNPFEVSVDVRNTGRRAGEETVQLYVGDEATTAVVQPVKELKGFRKVSLAAGEVKTVTFTLSPRDLAYFDIHRPGWVSTPGRHRIFIGSSSRDIREQQDFEWVAPAGVESSAGPLAE
jgi:beta-glucosidase